MSVRSLRWTMVSCLLLCSQRGAATVVGDEVIDAGQTCDVNAAQWTVDGDLYVGLTGNGTLNVTNGGSVSDRMGYVGFETGSNGTVTVDGDGSTWTNSWDLHVGNEGTGLLTVQNGAAISVGGSALVGGADGGNSPDQNRIQVDGVGSHLDAGYLLVGFDGTNGTVAVTNGGSVCAALTRIGILGSGIVMVEGLGSTLTNDSAMTVGNAGTGTLMVRDGALVSSVNTSLAPYPGSSGIVTVEGTGSRWTNYGLLFVGLSWSTGVGGGDGDLNIGSGGLVEVGDDLVVFSTGSVDLTGGTITANTFRSAGWVSGEGTIQAAFVNTGVVAPGHFPGVLHIVGGYAQPTGTLQIEIGGTSPTDYDQLDIAVGAASFAGTLDVVLIEGFVPAVGDSFDILDFVSSTGAFDQVHLPTLGSDRKWDTSDLYSQGVLSVLAVSFGDVNLDGAVNGLDIGRFVQLMTFNVYQLEGDVNLDGEVSALDISGFVSCLTGGACGTGVAGGGVVPEPGTLVIGAVAVAMLVRRRGR